MPSEEAKAGASREDVLAWMRREVGQEAEPGDWVTIDQGMIDQYAQLTGDAGWIHTDPERAAKSKFGGTIAQGNLGIAILPRLSAVSMYSRYPRKYSLNQGWDRIRFLDPLKTGSRVRARSKLLSVEEREDGSVRVCVEFSLEAEGRAKPWVTAVKVGRFYF